MAAAREFLRQANAANAWYKFGYSRNEAMALFDEAGNAFFRSGLYRDAAKAFFEMHAISKVPRDCIYALECDASSNYHSEDDVTRAVKCVRTCLDRVAELDKLTLCLAANRDLQQAISLRCPEAALSIQDLLAVLQMTESDALQRLPLHHTKNMMAALSRSPAVALV